MTGWDQADFRGPSVNVTLDPYYLCFLDENTPTVEVNGIPTIDLGEDLSGNLISGIENPCIVTRPALIASRPGGRLLNGQRRDIPLAQQYVRGTVGLSPGTPAEHLALIKVAKLVTRVWIVTGGAYPQSTPRVWPHDAADNDDIWEQTAIFATSITLKKQKELVGAQLTSGAIHMELRYEGRLAR